MMDPDAITRAIGPVLRRARSDGDLTQTEVAAALGISLWTYNRLENGKRTFTMGWIPRLPEKMRRPVTLWLMERTEERWNYLHRCLPYARVGYQRGAPLPQSVAPAA